MTTVTIMNYDFVTPPPFLRDKRVPFVTQGMCQNTPCQFIDIGMCSGARGFRMCSKSMYLHDCKEEGVCLYLMSCSFSVNVAGSCGEQSGD